MLRNGHPDDDVLEMYCREKLDGPELDHLEDHVLVCAECQDRVTETDSFVRGMRAAMLRPAETKAVEKTWERWNIFRYFQMPVPVWATAAVALAGLGAIVVTHNVTNKSVPLAIALTATRGATMPVAKAAGPLDLDLDARDLVASGLYHVQLVNSDGTEVWSADSDARNGHVHALVEKRLPAGQYYVRIADPVGTRREFALRLGN